MTTFEAMLHQAAAGHPPTLEDLHALPVPPGRNSQLHQAVCLNAIGRVTTGVGRRMRLALAADASQRHQALWAAHGGEPLESPPLTRPLEPSPRASSGRRP